MMHSREEVKFAVTHLDDDGFVDGIGGCGECEALL